jgi:opacity protein-like surface antigen
VGPLIATYAGPSHADLLFRTNEVMVSGMASEPGFLLSDFETGTPAGLRAYWAYRPALGLAATYSFSNYSSAQAFTAHGWDSPRELTTDLHELDFTLHYGLDFVRSQRILPYVGFGIGFAMADSRLSIDLLNTPQVHEDADDSDSPLLPNRQFEIEARDTTLTYLGLAGMMYRFGGRFAINAEIQGVMGDIRQTFEYAGSLQHIQPEAPPGAIDDWGLNDILGGSYPMDLNGMRLSIGVLVGL